MQIMNHVSGQPVGLAVGDELVKPGIPAHKMVYVGPIGPRGEDVVDPAKGQPAHFVHLDLILDHDRLLVGQRGTKDWEAVRDIQARAWEVVRRQVVNRTLDQNCEHIVSYIRQGKAESPQLRLGVGVGLALLFLFTLGRA